MEDEMGGECSKHGRNGKFTENLVGKPGRKRPLGRPKHR
jgi:hypothetical protein